MIKLTFGEVIHGLAVDGKELRAAVFNEHEVRAAAGLTMVLGAAAFVYAYFARIYLPIQMVTTLFFVEFLIRVTAGLKWSPMALDRRGIAVRSGHHCAQPILRRFGLAESVRASLGIYSAHDNIDALVDALREVAANRSLSVPAPVARA